MKVSEVSETQADNLVHMLDAYAEKGGHHLNINVFNRETLLDAQAHPEKYPAADHPRFRLCRELPHAHQGAAGRGHCAYLPRQVLKGLNSRRIAGAVWATSQNIPQDAKRLRRAKRDAEPLCMSEDVPERNPRHAPGFPAFTALRSAWAVIVADGDTCPGRCFAALPRNHASLWGWMGDLAVAAFSERFFIPFAG